MIRIFLIDGKIMMIFAWQKINFQLVQEDLEEIIYKKQLKGVNIFDLPIMHTCKYYSSSYQKEREKMIVNELINQLKKCDKNEFIFKYIFESFRSNNNSIRKSVIKSTHDNASFNEGG